MARAMLNPLMIELLDDAMVRVLRTKTPAERLAMAFDCNRTARLIIAGHLRTQHPDWTELQIQAGVAGRMLDGAT
jgi:Rv0078B-related antitoxin